MFRYKSAVSGEKDIGFDRWKTIQEVYSFGMSGYNFKKFKQPVLPKALQEAADLCRLDKIECAIVSVLDIPVQRLHGMAGKGYNRNSPPGLIIRRMYRMNRSDNIISEKWKATALKAGLNREEVQIAEQMRLSPGRILGMVSEEPWKDIPALHLRRLYDERHIHPALQEYWERKEGTGASVYTREYRKTQSKKTCRTGSNQ